MRRKVLLYIFAFFSLYNFAQSFSENNRFEKSTLLKSTITTAGASGSLVVSGGKNTVLQSIGQSGIVGTAEFGAMEIQQGFLNNVRSFEVNNSKQPEFDQNISLVISPNPFIKYINIDFSTKTKHPVHLKVYDVNGKIFINSSYASTKHIRLPMTKLGIGNYLIRLVSGENKYVKKLIKVKK